MVAAWILLYQGVLVCGLILGIFLLYQAFIHRSTRHTRPFAVLITGALMYLGVKLAVSFVRGTPTVFAVTRFSVLGAGVSTAGFFLFVIEYTDVENPISRRTAALLSVQPLLATGLILLDIEYFWVPRGLDASTLSGYAWELTSIAITNQVYMSGLLLLALGLLIRFRLQSHPAFNRQATVLSLAGAAAFFGNLVFYAGLVRINPTPIAFVLAGVVITWAIYWEGFLDLVPISRATVIDNLDAGVVTVDDDHRLIDLNDAASRILGLDSADQLVGRHVEKVLEEQPELQDLYWSIIDRQRPHDEGETEIEFNDRRYTVSVTELRSPDGQTPSGLGYTIQFSDITPQYRQRERIRRERDLKETMRSILVQLSSRSDIEQAFCDQLIADERYAFVWIGDRSGPDGLVTRTYASNTGGGLGPISAQDALTSELTEIALRALDTGDVTTTTETAVSGTDTPRDGSEEQDLQAGAAIPVVYNDLTYGVAVVRTTRADVFDSEERRLLADLGESIGSALNAVEQREALQGDQVREVVFQTTDPDHYLVSLSEDPSLQDTEFTITGYDIGNTPNSNAPGDPASAPETDQAILQFLSIHGAPAESLLDALTAHPDVESATILTENERERESEAEVSLRVRVQPPTLGSLLADVGGALQRLDVANGIVTVEADFSPRADMTQVLEHLQEVYPQTSITSLVTREPAREHQDSSTLASLTPKQRQALEAAYRSGFFERPQRQTAGEIAETLDVARPTFLQHLRKAEHEIFRALLDESEQSPDDEQRQE